MFFRPPFHCLSSLTCLPLLTLAVVVLAFPFFTPPPSRQADPRTRASSADSAAEIQTLWWRAPEVLFGSRAFGRPIDLWSLGMVLAEIGGWRFQAELHVTSSFSEASRSKTLLGVSATVRVLC